MFDIFMFLVVMVIFLLIMAHKTNRNSSEDHPRKSYRRKTSSRKYVEVHPQPTPGNTGIPGKKRTEEKITDGVNEG